MTPTFPQVTDVKRQTTWKRENQVTQCEAPVLPNPMMNSSERVKAYFASEFWEQTLIDRLCY